MGDAETKQQDGLSNECTIDVFMFFLYERSRSILFLKAFPPATEVFVSLKCHASSYDSCCVYVFFFILEYVI